MPKIRLFVDDDLRADAGIEIDAAKVHYLKDVMRLQPGDAVALFNGRHGEWRAILAPAGKRGLRLLIKTRLKDQTDERGPILHFAPIKRVRQEFLIEKATELGVAGIAPVRTRRSIVDRTKSERLRAIAIEAAEQCGRLTVPIIHPMIELERMLAARDGQGVLYVGDETGQGLPASKAWLEEGLGDVLIGPEGGFETGELEAIDRCPGSIRIDLGPRILRAETAALAALACGLWAG